MDVAIEQERYISGDLYTLAGVFDNGRDAVLLARTMKTTHRVVISKRPDNRWTVYTKERIDPLSKE